MFPRHDSLEFLSNVLHVSPSWLPTKRPPCFPFMAFYQTAFMFPLHGFLPNDLHVFSSWLPTKRPSWLPFMTPYHGFLPWLPTKQPSCSSSWLSTKCKKVMQRNNAKSEKISIFSSLDVKLEFLTSRVELTRFQVESSRVELKICSIRLELSWKCEQLNFESSRIQQSVYCDVLICRWRIAQVCCRRCCCR